MGDDVPRSTALFTASDLYALPQHVRSPLRGVSGLRGHPRASHRRYMQDSANELLRIYLPKLSEKGFEQASERGFGRCSVPKSGHPDPREAAFRAPPGLFRQFHARL